MSFFIRIITLLLLLLNFASALEFEVFEDRDSILKIDEVVNQKFTKLNIANKTHRYNKSTFWIKFELSNSSDKRENFYIKLFEPYIKVANLYRVEDKKEVSVKKNGYSIAYKERDLKTNFIVFKESIDRGEKIDFYLELREDNLNFTKVYILNERDFESDYKVTFVLIGVIYGIYLVMILYNFFIYLLVKDKTYLYYILYHIFLMIALFSLDTYPNIFFGIDINLTYISTNIMSIFIIKFTQCFLNSKESKSVDRFLNRVLYLIYMTLFGSFLLILYPEIFTEFFIIDSFVKVIMLVSIFIVSIYFYMRKNINAKVYILIWTLVSILMLVAIFIHLNSEFFTVHTYFFGHCVAVFEIALFSLALASRVNRLKEAKVRNEAIMIKKSKLADMGVMLNSISHQWRQPLMQIGSILMKLQVEKMHGKFSDKSFNDSVDTINGILKYMSVTIDDFRGYVKNETEQREFRVANALERALKICESALKYISIDITDNSKSEIYGNESEFVQVFINLLINSKSIFQERNIDEPYIKIDIFESKNYIEIHFLDSGGGIDKEVLPKIFEEFFTTRENLGGSGLGLSIVKEIITKNFHGKIEVFNQADGACFKILISTF